MLKLKDNPPFVSPQVASLGDLVGRWWVGHTKARCEKAFALDLQARGVGYFLPMVSRIWHSGNTRRHALLPLFSSYVFFCGGPEARYQAICTGRLAGVIEVANQRRFVDELMALEQVIRSRLSFTHRARLTAGQRCRIIAGPLEGHEGIVESIAGSTRVVLAVHLLGQGAAVDIHPDQLEVIGTVSSEPHFVPEQIAS